MKEWASNHPWMTFFLIDSAIAGVVKIVTGIASCFHSSGSSKEDAEVTVDVDPVEVEVEAE